ncbi:hypothetical protein RCL_jg15808.t1 [Rhizophagus clarus]|uniref:Uncharacterized protein n=1 Tax=Rhizophagus clarus TaxID=94130 RepID=A0A8H3R331_9GLOM|nr:hypothetical protein RCL_jg15808.t1 [Rhizophagus clarus]
MITYDCMKLYHVNITKFDSEKKKFLSIKQNTTSKHINDDKYNKKSLSSSPSQIIKDSVPCKHQHLFLQLYQQQIQQYRQQIPTI